MLRRESAGSFELCGKREALKTGCWRHCEESYIYVKNELCGVCKVVLRVYDSGMRQRILCATHNGYHENQAEVERKSMVAQD